MEFVNLLLFLIDCLEHRLDLQVLVIDDTVQHFDSILQYLQLFRVVRDKFLAWFCIKSWLADHQIWFVW